ncbi:MAG: protein-export chaperone SecB, partial [Xanthomonadales bacterium]|nr:protein-export chaperone SecB [Xanthomonadales bacterium]
MAEDNKTDDIMSPEDLADEASEGGENGQDAADQQGQGPAAQPAPAGMTPEQLAQAQFQIQKIYAKDISFEVPNGPGVFQEKGQADVKMSLSQRVESLGDDLHEIALTITITATIGDKTAYLAEVAQCGIFLIKGFPEAAMHAIVNTVCPNTLFPYARANVAEMVTHGGFPTLTLQPVNFDQLYAQRLQEAAAGQQGQDTGQG